MLRAPHPSLLRPLALALVCIGLATGGAEADQRMVIGHTSASLLLPDDFVPGQAAMNVRGVLSEKDWAWVLGAQMPDAIFLPSVDDPRYRAFLAQQIQVGLLPPDAKAEDVDIHGRKFTLISSDRKVGEAISHEWRAMTGPKPSVLLLFQQVEWPDKPQFLDRARVLELLATLEIGAPLPIETGDAP